MMKLVLIRHGESEWNKLNLFTGWTQLPIRARKSNYLERSLKAPLLNYAYRNFEESV